MYKKKNITTAQGLASRAKWLIGFLLISLSSSALAQQFEEFYVPLPEDQAFEFFDDIDAPGGGAGFTPMLPIITRTDIVIREIGTIVIFDPSADGFEADRTYATGPFSATTEFWGDGDCSNGFNPNQAPTCTTDTFETGEVVVFDQNDVSARDFFRANQTVNVTRSLFPTGTGTFLAGAFELFPASQFGNNYILPIGEDTIGGADNNFEAVALTIMASEDNTSVVFDPDGPGPAVPLAPVTLNRGESIEYGNGPGPEGLALVINQGATISANQAVQANVLTGDIGSTYEARFYTLFPNSLLSDIYYEAVGATQADVDTAVFIFNPNNTPITINAFSNLDPNGTPTATIPLAANSSAEFVIPTATVNGLTGIRFESQSNEVFTAYTVIDNGEQIHDWGHVTTPLRLLGDTIRVGFAPGNNPELDNAVDDLNASPIWVVADVPGEDQGQNIEICVDAEGDGGLLTDPISGNTFDFSVVVQPLDSTRLYSQGVVQANNGLDQTGMLAFACDSNETAPALNIADPSQVLLAAAWGQDPEFTAPGDSGFDVGTTIRTGSNDRLFIGDEVFEDLNGNGFQDPGEPLIVGVDVTISVANPAIDVDRDTPGIQNTLTVQTTTTGYLFTGLISNEDYTVTVTPPVGFFPTFDSDGVFDSTTVVNDLVTSILTVDFGFSQAVAIGDFIYNDANSNGTPDVGETGIANVEVQLCSEGDIATDDFENVAFDNFSAQWASDWIETGDNGVAGGVGTNIFIDGGSLRFNDTDAGINAELTRAVDLSGASGNAELEIVWAGATGFSGLDDNDVVRVQVSTDNGATFTDLFVFVGTAAGLATELANGAPAGVVFDNASDTTVISLPDQIGATNLQIRFSMEQMAGLNEFLDFESVTISEQTCVNTVTDAAGFYIFTGITNGDFTVQVDPNGNTLPASATQTGDPDAVLDGFSSVTIADGNPNLDQDFGYFVDDRLFLTGNVFNDLNALADNIVNGVGTDAGGLFASLVDEDGLVVASVPVRADGSYDFTLVDPNTSYTVQINTVAQAVGGAPSAPDLPAGFVNTGENVGAGIGNDGLANGILAVTTLALDIDNINFGIQPSAVISGNVSQDIDGDGSAANIPLENVVVQLYSDTNGDGIADALLQSVTTDAGGNYSFVVAGLAGDTDFVVVEINPAGLVSISDAQIDDDDIDNVNINNDSIPVTVSPSGIDADNDFVDAATASLEGTVWLDEDLDGIQDIEESGITSVTVQLIDDNGVVIATTVTDAAGDYSFDNVVPGDYTVNVVDTTLPAGLEGTAGIGGVDPKAVTVNAGDQVRDIDFGYVPEPVNDNFVGAIGDRVWADANGNGIQDLGEGGIESVALSLLNPDGSPVLNAVGSPLTTTTNANGDYLFIGVPLGEDYVVMIDDSNNVGLGTLVGFTPTQGPQSEGDFVSNPVTLTPTLSIVTDVDFGFDNPGLNTITDTIFFDQDGNGLQDVGDPGIANVTVNILDSNGNVVGTSISAPDGVVSFSGLEDDDYTLVVTDNANELNGLGGTTAESLVPVELGQSDPVSVAGGVTADGNDSFGYNNPGLIAGVVYADSNGNADQELNEAGIEGTVVTLLQDADNNGSFETPVDSFVTGVGGDYEFDGLPPGSYQVIVTPPGGTITEDPDSTLNSETDIILGLGESSIENDFGYTNNPALFDLFGTVFIDPDANGIEDPGEVGIASVTLDLIDRDSLTTYAVIGGALDINNDGQISRADDANVEGVTVIDGLIDLNVDGVVNSADDGTLAGVAVVNGLLVDTGGAPLTQIASSDGVIASTTTDGLGNYAFTGLPNGDYSVAVTDIAIQLAGYDITSGADVLDRTIDGADEIDVDFGYINVETTGSISGEVFIDEDGDGIADDPEFNITGVDVHLCTSPLLAAGQATDDGQIIFQRFSNAANTISTTADIETGVLDVAASVPQSSFGLVGSDAVVAANSNFGYIYNGFITVTELGTYEFSTTSDDGSVLLLDGIQVVDNDGLHGTVTVTENVFLEPGVHSIEARFFEAGGAQTFEVNFRTPTDIANSAAPTAIPSALLSSGSDICFPSHPNFVQSTVTDADGNYSFTDLPPAEYVVDSDPNDIPEGLDLTVDPTPVSLSEGENVTDVDIGYVPAANTGVLSGFVWTDVDRDGVLDPEESPIGGVVISVLDIRGVLPDTDPALPGVAVLASATTNPDGTYVIADLTDDDGNPLNDQVVDGLIVVYDNSTVPANLENIQPTNLPLGDSSYNPVDLESDENNNISFLDFAFPPGLTTDLGSISGTIYTDSNQDGDFQLASDDELQSVSVNLLNGAGIVIASTQTDVNGFYTFVGLQDDTYNIVITDNANVTQDLNPLETIPANIVISGGNDVTEQDAGFVSDVELLSIGNRFWFDTNRDGIIGLGDPDSGIPGEPGVEGITVQCWLDVNENADPNNPSIPSDNVNVQPEPGIDNLIRTVTTDENGDYLCTSLPQGQYIVVVADSNGFDEAVDGTIIPGGAGDNMAKPWTYALTLAPAVDPVTGNPNSPNLTADFGVSGVNTLSGTVFVEDDQLTDPAGADSMAGELDGVAGGVSPDTTNGFSDVGADGNPTVQNVPVNLFVVLADGTQELIQTVVSDANGEYTFEGLPDGNYVVEVLTNNTGVDGYGQTGDPDLVNVSGTSDLVCDSATADLCDSRTTTPISVDAGGVDNNPVNINGVDFGYQRGFTTTPVTINYVSLEASGSGAIITWETTNEVGHAGFQVYARLEEGWAVLHEGLILSTEGSSLDTRVYTFDASSVDATWFALVDVSANEDVEPHGPYRAGESYGGEVVKPDEFDWSELDLEGSESTQQTSESINSRVQQLLRNERSAQQ